jgi:hypothetical protein
MVDRGLVVALDQVRQKAPVHRPLMAESERKGA